LRPSVVGGFLAVLRKRVLTLVVALAALSATGQAQATTATGIRIGDHPAFVRVVVDFTGGAVRSPNVMALDHSPFGDGLARVEVRKPAIDTDAATREAFGVRARLVQGTNRIVLRLTAAPHRFKYLAYSLLRSPERLVVDLWKSRPPVAGAVFRSAPQGGCLTIASQTVGAGTAHAQGMERGIFENQFAVGVRGAGGRGRLVGVTSSPSGAWSRTFSYTVASRQAGTLEAVDFSEKDGSLVCIAQVRVTLRPPP
jgi:hypothetical protein